MNECSSLKNEEEVFMTTEEAATYLRISCGTLRNMTSNGRVKFYKLGRSNRYLQSDLRALVFSQPRGVNYGN